MLKQIFTGAVLSLAALNALAAGAPPVAAETPDQIVRNTTEKMQDLIRQNHEKYKADQASFYKVVDDMLVPHFDVKTISQRVMGPAWRSATQEQRDRFTDAFKLMLIRAYANTLLDNYDSVKAEWQPLRMAPDATDVVVRTSLMRSGGQPPVGIGFNMHKAGDTWLIYDVSVEAISLVTNFRSQITSEIKRTSLDDVIARMEKGESFKPSVRAQAGGS